MSIETNIMNRLVIDALLGKINASAASEGNARTKVVVNRIVRDLFYTIEDLDVTPDEFWTALNYLADAGKSGELGLLAAGLGFEHFLDLRLDEAEVKAGPEGGTPRTIEGPLYVAGAPESKGHARLDDGNDPGEPLLMRGRVLSEDGKPLADALVEPACGIRARTRKSECGPDGGHDVPADRATAVSFPLAGRYSRRERHFESCNCRPHRYESFDAG
jgi:hypothetical protein